MKTYNPNIHYGVHKVRLTLQKWNYKGHITYEMRGNCKGWGILTSSNFEDDTFENSENDCNLRFDEDSEYFTLELNDESGNTLEIQADGTEMNDLIVAVEILELTAEEGEE